MSENRLVIFELGGHKFSYDYNKQEELLIERKLYFKDVAKIFIQETKPLIIKDKRKYRIYREIRYNALGFLGSLFVNIAFTYRNDFIHLITAFPGSYEDKEKYYEKKNRKPR